MAYLLDKQDVNTLQQVTREVLGDLGGGRANYHREVQRRTAAEAPAPGQEYYNFAVITSNITAHPGADSTCDVSVAGGCFIRVAEMVWQPLTVLSGGNEIMDPIEQNYLLLMPSGRIFTSYVSEGTATNLTLTNVQLPCYIELQYTGGMDDTNGEGNPRGFHCALAAKSTLDASIRADYGERDLSNYGTYSRDAVLLAYITGSGEVKQIEKGVPMFWAIGKKPDNFTDMDEDNNLLPRLPYSRG